MTNDQPSADDAVFRVGTVVGVQGRTVRVSVDKAKNGSHLLYRGSVLRNVGVGGYLKIAKGFGEIIAKVDGETVDEAKPASDYRSPKDRVDRQLTVSLVGFLEEAGFRRGIRELPLVGNDCFLLTDDEFERIHNFVRPGDRGLRVGTVAVERGQPIRVGVDALFASHIGIFGNTGSGKSYTVAKLYYELFRLFRSSDTFGATARFVLIDFNGEYINTPADTPGGRSESVIAVADQKTEYRLSTRDDSGDRLPISPDHMEDPTLWTVLLDATEKTQAPFLQRALQSDYWERRLRNSDEFRDAVSEIVYAALKSNDMGTEKELIVRFLQDIGNCLAGGMPPELSTYVQDIQANLIFHSSSRVYTYRDGTQRHYANENDQFFRALAYDRLLGIDFGWDTLVDVDRIRFKILLQYYSDVFRGYANREHLGPLLKRLDARMGGIRRVLTVSDALLTANSLTVISLRDVSLEMKKVIPLLICRQLYDGKKATGLPGEYLNIIIDEAHTILSASSSRESEVWKDYRLETFEEIIKEGRKFGVFLTIASQRPHDISETIISQLHNYFLHRLVNNLDILAVEKAVSYLDRVSFESLPILPTGTCVLSGVSAQIPLVVAIDEIPTRFEPNNRTMTLADRWTREDEASVLS